MLALPLLFALLQLIAICWTLNKLLSKRSLRVDMNKINATQTVKICQYCGTETRDYAIFCPNCGTKLI